MYEVWRRLVCLALFAAVIATKRIKRIIFYGQYLCILLPVLHCCGSSYLVSGLLFWVNGHGFIKKNRATFINCIQYNKQRSLFPKLTKSLNGFGCRIKSFLYLPLGYSFNLDGSMMYMTFASIAIAQAYGIHMDPVPINDAACGSCLRVKVLPVCRAHHLLW